MIQQKKWVGPRSNIVWNNPRDFKHRHPLDSFKVPREWTDKGRSTPDQWALPKLTVSQHPRRAFQVHKSEDWLRSRLQYQKNQKILISHLLKFKLFCSVKIQRLSTQKLSNLKTMNRQKPVRRNAESSSLMPQIPTRESSETIMRTGFQSSSIFLSQKTKWILTLNGHKYVSLESLMVMEEQHVQIISGTTSTIS